MCAEKPQQRSTHPRSNDVRADARCRLGRRGEDLAAGHFLRLGFRVLARNVRSRQGEIDLIVFDGRVLVFAEVKTLRLQAPSTRSGPQPLAGLRPRQRARLRRLASAWLSDERNTRSSAGTIRFDALGVVLDRHERLVRLDHIEGAW
ncbi:MAG: YraN family protein [Solirubrobacteraceae bacterium]